jgi:putative transposase
MQEIWDEASSILRILTWAFDFKIHAFVLMANHYHLLVTTPSGNLDDGMRYFQSELSRWIHERSGTEGFKFGTRYRWSVINNVRYARDVFRYVIQNPLRAGVISSIEEYPYSTIHHQLGFSNAGIPIFPLLLAEGIPEIDDSNFEGWANELPPSMALEKIRKGLHYSTFKICKGVRASRKSA